MGEPSKPASDSPSPFLISSRGYALVLDTIATAQVDLADTRAVTSTVAVAEVISRCWPAPARLLCSTPTSGWSGCPRTHEWSLGVWKPSIGGTARV